MKLQATNKKEALQYEDHRRTTYQWRGGRSQEVTTPEDELQFPSESG
jgi:hypothetical protein